ncbi:MAG: helix-turn-helix transcriptional regulator, partial [Acidobacteriaceae bacterium]|nr:helix-turn-helix transcriptional regulator [Acidobacteriaceae bacterium]
EDLAETAGMSRARFAAHFLTVSGQTPFQYLALWRIAVAQCLLKKGQPLKIVAPYTGYASSGALTRAFSKYMGITPMAWLETQTSAI